MALTDVQLVRLNTSDQPYFRSEERRGNGSQTAFKLPYDTILESPAPVVKKDGVTLTVTTDYTVNYENGIVTFTTAPAAGAVLLFEVTVVVYTDDEINAFLSAAGGNSLYASYLNLLAWAASAAKIAQKRTLSGGGPVGLETLDTAVTAKELRETAKLYLDLYKSTAADSTVGPADGITEVPWTEHSYDSIYEQEIFRDS